ncbi:XrtY-associated glycosyltransferase XYAG1 [Chitinophaga pinensis]|uniref:Glycosyl transferase group 1 n=1 Tax=Chitinophaga pinensis (strain ATCC 43595 / DSM 2588 / LMG 13176 / NBRC 15968 / NCIMB 11800 / UQM 2034) TaxID=485918 RepID=A0A979G3E9_CHIPD|nr:glycosyltransferase [Chitinophaga pinensis]ACU59863.1 glycosyl transferase group 1 [Chitinophaga pinensis DSM 2588]
MNILHIIPSYKPAYIYGGPIYSSSALCEQLVADGHKVTVLTTTANGEVELDVPPGVAQNIDGVSTLYFKRVTKDNTNFSPDLVKYLYKNIKQYDAVHIHSWWNLVAIFTVLVCYIRRVRPVFSPRGMLCQYILETNHPFQKKIIQTVIGNRLLPKVKFHATSTAEVHEIKGLYPSSQVEEIFNFVSVPETPTVPKAPAGEKIKFLFMSRIDPKKGLELLFKGLSMVQFPYELNIAGPYKEEYLEQLKAATREHGIDQHVNWLGPVYGEAKFKLLRENDVMVLTSYNENFANIVIESLAVGTPVLISNMVGLSNYISSNDLGWISTIDPVNIKETLEKAYAERERLPELSMRAPQMMKKDFDRKSLVNKYLDLYRAN